MVEEEAKQKKKKQAEKDEQPEEEEKSMETEKAKKEPAEEKVEAESKEKPVEEEETPKKEEQKPSVEEKPEAEETPQEKVTDKKEIQKPADTSEKPSKQESKEVKEEKAAEEKPVEEEGEGGKTEAGFQHRVRVAGVVLDGNLPPERALTKIRGIGPRIATSIKPFINLQGKKRVGELSEKEIEELEKILGDLDKHLPKWMLNRQRDPETGKNIHLLGPDLEMSQREDINLLRRLKVYRGVRHSLNLPVRGQRTRTTSRRGTTIGVSRRKA
ncbi:30S ribosomal protein S13 [Candidatus Altiarchaeota archaeon]